MHAIISYSKLGADKACDTRWDPAKASQYFDRIHSSARRLLVLLNDLLDLAKLESGHMAYAWETLALPDIVAEVTADCEVLCRDKGVTLAVPGGPASVIVADRLRLGQVLRNLLANAIKFTPAGRAVTVSWASDHIDDDTAADGNVRVPAVQLTVSDEGIGIPEAELASVFDKFIQSSKTATGAGGTGLGLAICREIVAAHHGRIWAGNNVAGGADFHVLLATRGPAATGETTPSPHSPLAA